jgi:hypothetical protein
MKRPEKELQDKVLAAVRAHGAQKCLAIELHMSDTELSRLLSDHLPKLCLLLSHLELDVTDAGHVADLRRVLKTVL